MPRKPVKKRSVRMQQKYADSRREILDAARGILAEGGVEAITLAAVSAKLQLTKQALYHYFPSKEELLKGLSTTLLNDHIEFVISEVEKIQVEKTRGSDNFLGSMIRAFYAHYINHLNEFRVVYGLSQLNTNSGIQFDRDMLLNEVNPRTRHLFDILEQGLAGPGASKTHLTQCRRLAFSAWLGALGLMNMLSITQANDDPLIHSDEQLLDTLCRVFNRAAEEIQEF